MVVMLLLSYPLDSWKVSHISNVDVEHCNFIPKWLLLFFSPLNAHNQIDPENIRMSLDKCTAFLK